MMKKRATRIALTAATVAGLQGCAGVMLPYPGEVTTQVDGMNVTYIPRETGLDRWVNAQPVDLSLHETQTEKAMSLFGYPKLSWYPEGRLTYISTTEVAIIETPLYMRPTYGGPDDLRPQSGAGSSDPLITAGLGSGKGGLAAVGALASVGSSVRNSDPRTSFSHFLCYKAQEKYNASTALQSCWSDWLGQMRSIPQMKDESRFMDIIAFDLAIPTAAGGKGHAVMTMNRSRTEYFTGMAPVQMGGYKAHIFHFYPFIRSGEEGAFTVEELVAELGNNKPSDLVYLISGSPDTRKRTGVDPVGVVD